MEYLVDNDRIKRLIELIPVWTILTFVTIILGYIGFFTYCSLNNIPYNQPNIYTLVGIGILNLVFWMLIAIAARKGFYWKCFRALTVVGALYWLTIDPKFWGIIAVLYLLLFTDSAWNFFPLKNKSEPIEKKGSDNTITLKTHRFYQLIDLLVGLAVLAIGLYTETRVYIIFLFSYYLIYEVELVVSSRIIKSYHLFIFVVLCPAFISYSLLDKLNYSLIGISKSEVIVHFGAKDIFNGYLVYQDSENIYLKDSINSKKTIIYNKSVVNQIDVLDKIEIFKVRSKPIKDLQITKANIDSTKHLKPIQTDSNSVDTIRNVVDSIR